jgi:hypothetical protein
MAGCGRIFSEISTLYLLMPYINHTKLILRRFGGNPTEVISAQKELALKLTLTLQL